ncbi:MAG TPA: ATP-binding protein [Rhodoglobus sp.]|nr:ATP-binding protein [Rhodoglobus sp.]
MSALRKRVLRALDAPSPALKQSATALAVIASAVLVLVVPDLGFTNPPAAIAGLVIVGIACALALLMYRGGPALLRLELLIPIIDLFGIGAFRFGTGGTQSLFAALIILPVVWLASAPGRRHILYAWAGTSLALSMPWLLTWSVPQTAPEWLRLIVTPTIFAIAGAIVNELARLSRTAVDDATRLAADKERMLQRTVEYAAQLQDSEAKYRAADRMFRGVWAAVTEQSVIGTDVTGLIDLWNPGATKLLGLTEDEADDKLHIFDFHDPDELEAHARELNYPPGETVLNPGFSALVESARLGEAEVREWTYIRPDGTRIPVELSVTKRVDEEGRTRGYLFVATDITKAKEVARLKDEFVGLISHELRTPLSSILGYLELMRDDEDQPLSAEQLQYLGVAERNANRLLRLVGDLLFTAQVESGKFALDNRELGLASIVSASIETGRPLANAAGVDLALELPPQRVAVFGDPVRLGQAVDNLISNAIKFTPRGGSVTVSLFERDGKAVVEVRDTGLGIAASELDKLFSRFFRATTATRNAVPGVGLGLTITKAIVIAHHGEMAVESEEGVGTCFSMSLPLVVSAVPVS